MKLRDLFSRKPEVNTIAVEPAEIIGSTVKLDLDALDACVGGKADTDGVGCYVHSTRSNVH
jgi:hypothetical protein